MGAEDSSEIDVRGVERSISAQMETSRKRAGLTIVRIVSLLSPLQPRAHGGTNRRQKWYEWRGKPDTVSAVTFVYAGLLANMPWALEIMQAGLRERGEPGTREQIETLRGEVAALRAVVMTCHPDAAPLLEWIEALEARVEVKRGGVAGGEKRQLEGTGGA